MFSNIPLVRFKHTTGMFGAYQRTCFKHTTGTPQIYHWYPPNIQWYVWGVQWYVWGVQWYPLDPPGVQWYVLGVQWTPKHPTGCLNIPLVCLKHTMFVVPLKHTTGMFGGSSGMFKHTSGTPQIYHWYPPNIPVVCLRGPVVCIKHTTGMFQTSSGMFWGSSGMFETYHWYPPNIPLVPPKHTSGTPQNIPVVPLVCLEGSSGTEPFKHTTGPLKHISGPLKHTTGKHCVMYLISICEHSLSLSILFLLNKLYIKIYYS